MKGILKNTKAGWFVLYQVMRDEITSGYDSIPLHPYDIQKIEEQEKVFDNIEARIAAYPDVHFEIVNEFDNNGPEHFPKYAKLKDWDVTLNGGLENEPCVSDDFQIGPDGAYEHIEYAKSTMVFAGEGNWGRSAYIKLEDNKVIFDCSDEEYGPIVFDIDLLKDALNKHII